MLRRFLLALALLLGGAIAPAIVHADTLEFAQKRQPIHQELTLKYSSPWASPQISRDLVAQLTTMGIGPGAFTPPYVPNAIDADGTNDYLTSAGYTGAADSSQFMLMAFLRVDGGDGSARTVHQTFNGTGYTQVYIGVDNKFAADFTTPDGASILSIRAATAYTAGPAWLSLLISVKTDLSAGNKIAQLYVGDTNDVASIIDASASFDMEFTTAVGIYSSTLGAFKWNGCISNLMVWFGDRLDISVEANRRKYVNAAGKPVNPGATGTLITGNQPIAFYAGAAAAPGVNSGSGGDATVTGSFDACSTNPASSLRLPTYANDNRPIIVPLRRAA